MTTRKVLIAVRVADGERYPGFEIDVTDADQRKIDILTETAMMGFDETVWQVVVSWEMA